LWVRAPRRASLFLLPLRPGAGVGVVVLMVLVVVG
jgi:hypothetical protein